MTRQIFFHRFKFVIHTILNCDYLYLKINYILPAISKIQYITFTKIMIAQAVQKRIGTLQHGSVAICVDVTSKALHTPYNRTDLWIKLSNYELSMTSLACLFCSMAT